MVVKGQLLEILDSPDEEQIETPLSSEEETDFDIDDFDELETKDEVFN